MEQEVEIGIRKWINISKYQILERQGGVEKSNLWPETFEDFKKGLVSTLNSKRVKSVLFYEFFAPHERQEIDGILNQYKQNAK